MQSNTWQEGAWPGPERDPDTQQRSEEAERDLDRKLRPLPEIDEKL